MYKSILVHFITTFMGCSISTDRRIPMCIGEAIQQQDRTILEEKNNEIHSR